MDSQETRDRKSDFVLWVYWAASRPLERHRRDYVAYLTEVRLRKHGFTSGYKFADGVIGPADRELQNEAVILSDEQLLDGPVGTNIIHITERGKNIVKYLSLERMKAWFGRYYGDLENYVHSTAELGREELLQRVRDVSGHAGLESLAAA